MDHGSNHSKMLTRSHGRLRTSLQVGRASYGTIEGTYVYCKEKYDMICTTINVLFDVMYIYILHKVYHPQLVHTPSEYTLLVSTHSWLVHTPGWYTLLVSTHSWLVRTPG